MASKQTKKNPSSNRANSATPREAASVAASSGGGDKRPKLVIWPEWNDADVNAEKWDVAHKGKGKDDKGKSPVVQHFFEDPDGKVDLPQSLKVDHWKRPQDFVTDGTPVVVDSDGAGTFDLISKNEHIHNSELMRCIISQIQAVWEMHSVKPTTTEEPATPSDESTFTWKPWEHIYSLCKVGKGPHIPLYNSHGKYIVRLYWMGCWRKITIDDSMPFDEEGRLLLPSSSVQAELWPMLLAKALLKVASLDYNGGSNSSEFGDCSIIHCLTGWLPETIPLHGSHINEVWELLKSTVPEWKLPVQEWEKTVDLSPDHSRKEGSVLSEFAMKDDRGDKDSVTNERKGDKPDSKKDVKEKGAKDAKEKEKAKDGDKKDKKDKDKDKDKNKEKSMSEDGPIPEKTEVVVFASYWSTPKHPAKVSVLGEVADAGERLRQNGLSHLYPHPVWITQTRSCPLEPPPPPENIPAWKLIRPRVKKTTPSDEPKAQPEPPKPIQCLEVTSPFVNYKVSPLPIPSDTHRPKSSLERGGARSRASTSASVSILETDENAPESQPLTGTLKVKSESGTEVSSKPSTPLKPGTPVGKRKPGSASKQYLPESERKASRVGSQGLVKERVRSAAGKADSKSPKLDEKDQRGTDGSMSKLNPSVMSPSDGQMMGDMSAEPGEEVSADIDRLDLDDAEMKPKKFWMDYDMFFKCFRSLHIFHKPSTYMCNHKHSDLKCVAPAPVPVGKDKKGTPGAQGVNPSSSKTSQTPTHTTHGAPSPSNPSSGYGDDKSHHYLFVDNLNPTEIVVSYSAICRWHEPPIIPPPLTEDKKSHSSLKGKEKDMDKEMSAGTSSSLLEEDSESDEGSPGKDIPPQPITPATLVAEPYSWKSLVTGQPVLRLRTTATRSAVLNLPAGRHVLRFMMSSPLGYHVHLCSTVNFVFGEEETVMSHLKNESCRFVENANQVINGLGRCINSYQDSEMFKTAFDELVTAHCPYRNVRLASKQHHFQVFNESLYHMLRNSLGEGINPDMVLAWRAFNFDVTTKCILGNLHSSRPTTGNTSHRGSAKTVSKKHPDKVENPWVAKYMEPSVDEHIAAVRLQKVWRGYWVRKIKSARQPGTDEHSKALDQLQKAWVVIESNAESLSLSLFRHMFKTDPELMPYYSFHKDEWNRISYEDYQGSYPDQPSHTWFVVFREIFYVQEEMLAVPKVYVPISTCMLRVINNDTGEEIPRVFHKVAPHVYKKNKRGYTFVADARSTDLSLMSNKWRMRLIGSLSPLPAPIRQEVNCSFIMKEIKDYYMPNEKNTIFRYSVKVTEDHLASLQVNTSKPDVYIKLMVLDNEEEVISTIGKGHAVLPAYIFHKDIHLEDKLGHPAEEEKKDKHDDHKRSGSRASTKTGKGAGSSSKESVGGKAKRSSSAKSQEGRTSRSSPVSEVVHTIEYDEKDLKPHKYIIQAEVLKNSWPLSESAWTFVNMLKELEKNELKVAFKERPPSPPKNEKAVKDTKGGKAAKGGKDKGGKDKDGKTSRPPSQQFDISKPFWVLRFVSDASAVDDVEVKRDTERADEIRATKKAWEDSEPGRAAKAQQSRLKYLNSHMIRVHPEPGDVEEANDDDDKSTTEGTDTQENPQSLPPATPMSVLDHLDDAVLTLEPPPPPTPKEVLQPLDITPFIRKGSGEQRYLDEAELQRQIEQRQQEIQEYRAFRERVEKWREQDKQTRNLIKQKQLEDCEELQAALDSAREAVNIPREAIRQRHLDEERRKQEELLAQEAAKAELEAKSPKGKKGSAKGKKSAGKKKK